MRFAGLKIFMEYMFNFNLKRAEVGWRYHDAVMAVGSEDEENNIFETGK